MRGGNETELLELPEGFGYEELFGVTEEESRESGIETTGFGSKRSMLDWDPVER